METRTVHANDVDFYVELRGEGPVVLLYPDGCNDCGPYGKVADLLAEHYRVITFDPRGGTRSMPAEPAPVTPSVLADDAAAILAELGIDHIAGAYGCSSGGQAVLALGKRHPQLVGMVLAHEAALQSDTPLPGAGFEFFKAMDSFKGHMGTSQVSASQIVQTCTWEGVCATTPEMRVRKDANAKYWGKWYMGSVDGDSYSAADFAAMPPVAFSVGTFSPGWIVYANIETAKRGSCPVTWINCGHHPECSCPEVLADYIHGVLESMDA